MAIKETIHTRLRTLDVLLLELKARLVKAPKKGWIAEIRTVLGMRANQLSHKLGVDPSTVSFMEKSERNKTITLSSLERAANALNCDLYYSFIPRGSMEDLLMNRALEVIKAENRLNEITMTLESQGTNVGAEDSDIMSDILAGQLVANRDRKLWDTFEDD